MVQNTVFTALLLLFANTLLGQYSEGTLKMEKIYSPSISGNIFNDPATQDVAIYLPPTYNKDSAKKYPVLYFLCGYLDELQSWTENGYFQGFVLKDNLDKLINEGAIKEMIVVIPNSYTLLEGSFFANSSVNGNYETFYTEELVHYVDNNYRTIPTNNARAIAGHSMGGSGALDLSMKHPDIYCMGYGLCSGLFAPDWVEESLVFRNIINPDAALRKSISLFDTLSKMPRETAHEYYIATIDSLKKVQYGWFTIFGYAYGTAFVGDSTLHAPYFNYPFYIENDTIKTDSAILADWEAGFGALPDKIERYKDNLLSLKEYVLDYGEKDFWKYIVSGHEYYHQLLKAEGIPHKYINNGGDHESKVEQQIETSLLPLCSNTLEFDTVHLNSAAEIIQFSIPQQVGNSVVDAKNKTIHIVVPPQIDMSAIVPVIQTPPGAEITPKSRKRVDFSTKPMTYTIVSESGKNTETWQVTIEQESTSKKKLK